MMLWRLSTTFQCLFVEKSNHFLRYIWNTICTLFVESATWMSCMMWSGKAVFFSLHVALVCWSVLYWVISSITKSKWVMRLEHRCVYPLLLFLCLSFLLSFSNSVTFGKFTPLCNLFSGLFDVFLWLWWVY